MPFLPLSLAPYFCVFSSIIMAASILFLHICACVRFLFVFVFFEQGHLRAFCFLLVLSYNISIENCCAYPCWRKLQFPTVCDCCCCSERFIIYYTSIDSMLLHILFIVDVPIHCFSFSSWFFTVLLSAIIGPRRSVGNARWRDSHKVEYSASRLTSMSSNISI